MRRLILLAIVAIALAPGTWVRSTAEVRTISQQIALTKLDLSAAQSGAVELVSGWHLQSRNNHFGGYSALVILDDGRFLAASDRGRVLEFSPPDSASGPGQQSSRMAWFRPGAVVDKHLADIESMTRDPATGILWAGYEDSNSIMRLDTVSDAEKRVYPSAMADWSSNAGPEAMVRLEDGRFVVISEALGGMLGREAPALLFDRDPAEGGDPARFTFQAPGGYRATDMAVLPDGRALILVRQLAFGIPPGFRSKLVLADPADITAGKPWSGETIATLDDIAPSENYEAMAIEPGEAGAVTIWVMSDDNTATLQRTLLLKLRYTPLKRDNTHEKAREKPARSSN